VLSSLLYNTEGIVMEYGYAWMDMLVMREGSLGEKGGTATLSGGEAQIIMQK
jgi:hypothetical protein